MYLYALYVSNVFISDAKKKIKKNKTLGIILILKIT